MQARPIAHPTDDVLLALGSGKLNSSLADTVLAHLDTCPECLNRATGLSGDDLLQRLRAAHSRATDASAGNTPAARSTDRTPEPSTPSSWARSTVPVELLENKDYEIVRELGRGGMGVVYLARHRLTKRLDVLKVVSRSLLDQAGAAQRFLNEIEVAARLSHPNIMTAYSAFQVGDLLMFAVEYLEGADLARVVKENGPLPVVNACVYALQTAQGLKHAHEKGIVHRDIKPSNLFLKREGKKHTIKILDFGLAKAKREERANTALTGSHMTLGTPDYMAPEQAMNAAAADIRADIYSLGCTLYYLLSGKPPFQGGSVYEVMHAHQAKTAIPLDQVRQEVPAELAAVVARMMAKDPAERYQTPTEVLNAVVEFVKGPAKPEPREASSQTAVAPPSPPQRAPRWPVVLGGIVAVLLCGLLGMWAAGVFRVKTPEGTLEVEVEGDDVEVFVDGEKANVTWDKGKKSAVVRLQPGTRKVEVKKDGITVRGEEVEILDGKLVVLRARLTTVIQPPVKYDLTGGFRVAHFGQDRTLAIFNFRDDLEKRHCAQIFDLTSGLPCTPPLEHSKPLGLLGYGCREFSPDGTRVATGSQDMTAQVWDAATGKKLTPPLYHKGTVVHLSFSPDGKRLATASQDNKGRIWDAWTGKLLTAPLEHEDVVGFVLFSPDSKFLVTTSRDKKAQVWDAATGKKIGEPLEHRDTVCHACFSPDGKRVATGSDDSTARVWDARTGKPITPFLRHAGSVIHIAFSPDGKRVVTASLDKTARVWDTETGKELCPAMEHKDALRFVSFSPDGARICTASHDMTAQIWETLTGKPIGPPLTHDRSVLIAFFSPDGRQVFTNGSGTRRLWDAKTGKELHRAPVVVATFRHVIQVPEKNEFVHRFYSNGRIGEPNGGATWEVQGTRLTLRWPNPNAKIGYFQDDCTLTPDGRKYTGINQEGVKTTGEWKSGMNLTKWPPYKE